MQFYYKRKYKSVTHATNTQSYNSSTDETVTSPLQ